MSTVEKLLIQGIRSFGPADDQKGVIQFGTPLTLITGQNGAGKTTIIECLKYVTTGDLPPNSKGAAFVHDPKLVGEREVRAVVKLKFKDISGTSVVCHRMLQSSQKLKRLEQRSLETCLEKVVGGVKRKISSRCAEVDAEMITHIGVSKAILDNVIFCHQEESFWPLTESTTVKKKFDQIFAATRYTKALESVKIENKKQVEEGKRIEAELQHLQKNKDEAEKLETTLRMTQQKVDAQREEIASIKTLLKPAETRLQVLHDMHDRVAALQRKITVHESSRDQLLRTQEELRKRIGNIFTGSQFELQQAYDEHNTSLLRSKRELEEVERKYKYNSEEVKGLKDQLSDCNKEHGRIKTQDEYHQQRVKARDKRIVSVGEKLKIGGYERAPFSSPVVRGFLKQLVQLREKAEESARRKKQDYLSQEKQLQHQLNELRSNLAQLEHSKTSSQRTVEENRKTIVKITRELAEIGAGGAALEAIEQDLATAERELSEYQAQCDMGSLEAGLEKLREEKRTQDARVTSLQQEMGHISQQASARGALDALRKDRRNKEEAYQNELCALEPDLLAVLGHVPIAGEDQEGSINKIIMEKQEKVRRCESQLQQANAQLSRAQTLMEQHIKELASKQSRIQVLQAEVADVCDDTSSYEEAVQDIQAEIEDANENLATVKGSQAFFRKSLEKIHLSKKCPLCVRGFDSQSGFEQVVKTITDRLNQSIPKLLPQLTEKLQTLQLKQQKLQQLRPKMEERTRLRSEELPRLEGELEGRKMEVGSLRAEVKKTEGLKGQLLQELEQARSVLPRVGRVAQGKRELHSLDQRISAEQSRIGGDASRSHFTVGRELAEAQRNADELNRKMDHKRQEINDYQQMRRQLEDEVHRLREEKLKLQSRLQQRQTLVAKKEELAAQNETMEREIKTVSNQLGPVAAKIAVVEQKKGQLAEERDEAEALSRTESSLLSADEKVIKDHTDTILSHVSSGADRALGECERRLGELQALIEGREQQRRELEERKEILQKKLANAKVKERELEDNLVLMQQRKELAEKEAEIKRLKAELNNMGLEGYEEECCKTQETVDRLSKEQAHMEGQMEGHMAHVRQLQAQLHNDLFKDSEKKYTQALHKQLVVQQTKEDLKKYYTALDRSIMTYHKSKMATVNSIVKDLWIKTYKGGDIDYIELQSDSGLEDDFEIGARRTYNYRIVMMKNDQELNMRGRCSAGQKVIASIIIRLALAETFCLNCGILALDEPTTNLDADNVGGLAESLAEIVKARRNQINFQLIVITHDEKFIELLGRGYTDCFYRVTKRVGETSRIQKEFFSGLER